ncbi:hypothetical protein quinque_015177 [Culex quinquefasciatus]
MEKIRTKHEKDFLALKVELQQEIKKFEKLQLQATKLQQQLSIVNDKNLDLMKENEFCKSKLRIMEEIRDERKSMLPPPAHARLCSNLKMEDEEGEIFNNTYLTDLKAGRMTSPVFGGRESVRYSELQQRNSMQPPHLKSSYLPQYTDGDLTDDDRDAASVNLDDSSTSLISRRKQGGTTSYKRPGPPTPSKKAGRLSFGGSLPTNDFQYKEIANNASSNSGTTSTSLASRLSFGGGRKSNVDSSTVLPGPASGTLAELNARRKTPGKFKQMFSSSNLLNTLHKDEPTIAPTKIARATHPAIHKITCLDDTDSGSSGPEDRRAARFRARRRESIGLRASSRAHKVPHVRKLIARFDKNRRLSSVDSDTDGSPKTGGGDPYDGFGQYEYGTPVQRIDINAMAVFDRKELPLPKVIVFSGEGGREEVGGQNDHHDQNNNLESGDFVKQLSIKRRAKQRRKSRDQRRESFNRQRDIDAIAIADSFDLDEAMLIDSTEFQFESMLQDITLDRPSEILPRGRRRNLIADQLDNVVTSSTGMPAMTGIPLLERFSEIFRIATQQSKIAAKVARSSGVTISSAGSTESPTDWSYYMLVLFAGLSFSSLVFSLYMHYVDYRVSRE